MAILRRVDLNMTGVPGTPWFNSLHFGPTTAASAQACADVALAFWNDLSAFMSNAITIRVEPEVVNVNDATGDVVGFEPVLTAPITGKSSQPRLPAPTQGLIRLRSDLVVSGRRIQGKIFVPGLTAGASTAAPEPEFVTFLTSIGEELLDAASLVGGLRVLSRKNLTSAGVTSATGWDQWAVLRSRRD